MTRHLDDSKDAAARLAAFFTTDTGAPALRAFRRLLGRRDVNPRVPTEPRPAGAGVGVWEPQVRDGETYFVRSGDAAEAERLWAAVEEIPPKRDRRRVVLLGESVARGFLLDPHYNPAKVLESQLRCGAGDQSIDVIDLARTDQTLAPLVELAAAALRLEPDVLVVFAGNNWRPRWFQDADACRAIGRILSTGGSWATVRRHLETSLAADVRDGLGRLAEIAQDAGVPLVFVLPEFNLVDWRTEVSSPPLLGAIETREWRRLRRDAEQAAADGDEATGVELARRMMALDGGSTPVGADLAARAQLRAGALSDARALFAEARDAGLISPQHESPRCYSVVQDAVCREAASHGFTVVDLRAAFREACPERLPDRHFFFDYCHLTPHGIDTAMAAVARQLFTLGFASPAIRHVGAPADPVRPDVVAEAHFLAAIHNANWGQPAEIVHYHCREALRHSPAIASMMSLFLSFHARRAPAVLCREFNEFRELGSVAAMRHLFNFPEPTYERHINWRLVEAMTDAAGLDRAELWQRAGYRPSDVAGETEIDLTARACSADTYVTPFGDRHVEYYRATANRSRFRFVCVKPIPCELILTSRCRLSADGAVLSVSLNGQPLGAVEASRRWTSVSITIPASALRAGVNEMTIDWPPGTWDERDWRRSVAEAFEDGRVTPVTRVSGELHRLRIRLGVSQPAVAEDDAARPSELRHVPAAPPARELVGAGAFRQRGSAEP